jgi:hypothetical protein
MLGAGIDMVNALSSGRALSNGGRVSETRRRLERGPAQPFGDRGSRYGKLVVVPSRRSA